ncbi:MAG TPA: hypothetical protein VF503_09245 [Sphingobium sp.]|uniref:hypothetical protein n=1 Tax=Sphingobium sp. TaxID=1912891 RepID=UPI002ED32E27
MTKSNSLMAGVSRFAHFAGLSRTSAIGAGEEEDTDRQSAENSSGDDDDDDDEGDQSEAPGGKGTGADDGDTDDDSEGDDDEKEMRGDGAVASARRREQQRICHILGHASAANNVALAVSLACETRMTRKEAVALLTSQPAATQGSGPQRNQHSRPDRSSRNADLSSDTAPPNGREAVNASWGKAFAKAGVKSR